MDSPPRVPQGLCRPTGKDRLNLRDDRQRNLLRCVAAQIQPHRAVEIALRRYAGIQEVSQQLLPPPARTEQADIRQFL